MCPIWKRTVITYYMNKERREIVNREDKIMVVTFLNSQFEKATVQFLGGDHQDVQYKIRRVKEEVIRNVVKEVKIMYITVDIVHIYPIFLKIENKL